MLLLPVIFIGGCYLSLKPVFLVMERFHIHPFHEADRAWFPILVRYPGPLYSCAQLRNVPDNCVIVTDEFPVAIINRDLQQINDSSSNHTYFRVLSQTTNTTFVTLEVPPRAEGKIQGWYEITNGQVIPRKVLNLGIGFAYELVPFVFGCGFLAVFLFRKLVGYSSKRGVLPRPL
ncbi:MAG TPA: hypothetical protein VNH19_07910 [Candidatus Limnocylindrales bacterium]|nr:hypothetical protein [Candidatus Limnocylindrales bacterium]